MHFWQEFHRSIIGTAAAIFAAWLFKMLGDKFIDHRTRQDAREHYRERRILATTLLVAFAVALVALWAGHFKAKGTFFGLIGAGLAVALREPLLSIAGRIVIFAAHMYTVGDRIEINKMSGDVIDVGFVYTRMMEIGNWIGGDQYSGRIVQFANAQIFGTAVFNYTRNFAYIWDEVKLPITYDSNLKAAQQILVDAGGEYTQAFMEGAQAEVQHMQHTFQVENFELWPQTYVQITDNYLVVTMRYLVAPRKRRSARNFIFNAVLEKLQDRDDIQIGSSTMDVTVQPAKGQAPLMITERPNDGEKAA